MRGNYQKLSAPEDWKLRLHQRCLWVQELAVVDWIGMPQALHPSDFLMMRYGILPTTQQQLLQTDQKIVSSLPGMPKKICERDSLLLGCRCSQRRLLFRSRWDMILKATRGCRQTLTVRKLHRSCCRHALNLDPKRFGHQPIMEQMMLVRTIL